jgi:hypothetical protein
MSEKELIRIWMQNRNQIILSQIAPTALLGASPFIVSLLLEQSLALKISFSLILLASGILGAWAQFSAAEENEAVAISLGELKRKSEVSRQLIQRAPMLSIIKWGTTTIFTGVFIAILIALFN